MHEIKKYESGVLTFSSKRKIDSRKLPFFRNVSWAEVAAAKSFWFSKSEIFNRLNRVLYYLCQGI